MCSILPVSVVPIHFKCVRHRLSSTAPANYFCVGVAFHSSRLGHANPHRFPAAHMKLRPLPPQLRGGLRRLFELGSTVMTVDLTCDRTGE